MQHAISNTPINAPTSDHVRSDKPLTIGTATGAILDWQTGEKTPAETSESTSALLSGQVSA